MRRYPGIFVFCFILLPLIQINAQDDANELIKAVYNKLQKANDYSVDANIKLDMPFVRILPVNVSIYYRQDNKFKVVSKSIAIVPRQGFDQLSKMLADADSYTAMVQGEEKIGTVQTSIVNIIPLSDTSDLILGKLWIDPAQHVILKSQLTTRSSGTIVTEYAYGSQIAYGLPEQMIFSIDATKFKMPKAITGDMYTDVTNEKDKGRENKKGKIYINLTNYKVNKGIPDSIFDQ
jgi:hypothetical protein